MRCPHNLFRGFRARTALCLLAICLSVAAFASPVAAQQQQKFAAALFHCNIQYVAGGTLGMLPLPGLVKTFPNWEQDDDGIHDLIIDRSFEPMLDLYLKHPTWGLDIEMQAYYLEVLADRRPAVLTKLMTLINNGQAEVISFHYSDQLFLAFGRPAWDRSIAETQAVFQKYGVPLADVVFGQEGQSGMGMAAAMEAHGYKHMVWPKNLWSYQHGDWNPDPLYTFGNLDMVPAPKDLNYNNGELQLTWTYLDDQEVWATNGIDPYFPPIYWPAQKEIDAYEQQLTTLETNGYAIAKVSDYFQAAATLGVTPTDPPPLFDGTWQPNSTDGIHRWLGGGGDIFFMEAHERDNHVRTLNEIANRELLAAETIAKAAGLSLDDEFDALWRMQNLGTVSDASGINCIGGEVAYGISHSAEATRRAREIIEQAKAKLGLTTASINTQTGAVTAGSEPAEPPIVSQGPIDPQIYVIDRVATPTWRQVSTTPPVWRLDIAITAGANRSISVVFPGHSTDVVFTHALSDDQPVVFHRSDFTFDHWWMALPNGMINVEDDLFVVKDMSMTHVAAKIMPSSGYVTFEDDVATPNSAITWRFYLVQGAAADAVAFANALNVQPTLVR